MNLFQCETIPHIKIGEWLESDNIAQAELLDHSTVRITNPAGLYLTVRWADGQAELI